MPHATAALRRGWGSKNESLSAPTHHLLSHRSGVTGVNGGFSISAALVSWDSRNKVSQMEWLKQQKFLLSWFWRLAVRGQGVGKAGAFP